MNNLNTLSTFTEVIDLIKAESSKQWLLPVSRNLQIPFEHRDLYYPTNLFLNVFNQIRFLDRSNSLQGCVFSTIKRDLELIDKTRKKNEYYYEFDVKKNMHKLKNYLNLDDMEWEPSEETPDVFSMYYHDDAKVYGGYQIKNGALAREYFDDNLNLGMGRLAAYLIERNYKKLFFYEFIYEKLDDKKNQTITNNPSFGDSPFFWLENKEEAINEIMQIVFSKEWYNNTFVHYKSIEEKLQSLKVSDGNIRNKMKLIEHRNDFTISLIYYACSESLELEIYSRF